MDYTHLLSLAAGLLGGLIAGLRVVAPLTKSDKDDRVLALLLKMEQVVDVVVPVIKATLPQPAPAAPAVPAPQAAPVPPAK